MLTFRNTIGAGLLVLAFGAIEGGRAAHAMWDTIASILAEGKKHRAFCAKNPANDKCKDHTASTLLIWCESALPENLGRCHGALWRYAGDGAKELAEWQCVPSAVTRDTEQLRRLFLREAQRVPEVLHLPARQLAYYAVVKAFPCPLRAPRR